MASYARFGKIEKTAENKTYTLQIKETQIEWKIPYFIKIIENESNTNFTHYNSPDFSIDDISCFLALYPISEMNREFMRLFLEIKEKPKYSSAYVISLKKLDGNEEYLVRGLMKEKETRQDMGNIIKRSDLKQRKFELAPQNTLTIICRYKPEIPPSAQPIPTANLMPPKLIRLDKLSDNFKNIFADKESCDVTLKIKDIEYQAHRTVLIARSSVFAANFKHDTLEKQTRVITITDCEPSSFEIFLEYLYCGKVEDLPVCSALDLYYTSDKYDIQDLKAFCVECLMQKLTVENMCEVAVFADKYEETYLFFAVQNFFNKNMHKVFRTDEWDCLLKEDRRLANKLLISMSDTRLEDYV